MTVGISVSASEAMPSLIEWVEKHRDPLADRDYDTMRMLTRHLEAAIPSPVDGLRSHFFKALRGDLMGAIEFFHALLPDWNYMLESNDGSPLARVNATGTRGSTFFASHVSPIKGERGSAAFAMLLVTLRASFAQRQSTEARSVAFLVEPTSAPALGELPTGAPDVVRSAAADDAATAVDPDRVKAGSQANLAERPIVVSSVKAETCRSDRRTDPLDNLATIDDLIAGQRHGSLNAPADLT